MKNDEFSQIREQILDALIGTTEGFSTRKDFEDARHFLGKIIDMQYPGTLYILVPIVNALIRLCENWRDFLTIDNIKTFLTNPVIIEMVILSSKLKEVEMDFETEFMVFLYTCFISEYNNYPEKQSPDWWYTYLSSHKTKDTK